MMIPMRNYAGSVMSMKKLHFTFFVSVKQSPRIVPMRSEQLPAHSSSRHRIVPPPACYTNSRTAYFSAPSSSKHWYRYDAKLSTIRCPHRCYCNNVRGPFPVMWQRCSRRILPDLVLEDHCGTASSKDGCRSSSSDSTRACC